MTAQSTTPLFERRHHFGEGHADRGRADAGEEVAHGVVEDADLLALEAVEPADDVAAPEHLRRVAAEREELRVPVLLHLPVDHLAIGVAGGARLVGIERQPGEVAGLEARVVAGHLRDVHAGEIHHAELQQPQHRLVVDAHLVERRDVGGDRALRRLGIVLRQNGSSSWIETGVGPLRPMTLNWPSADPAQPPPRRARRPARAHHDTVDMAFPPALRGSVSPIATLGNAPRRLRNGRSRPRFPSSIRRREEHAIQLVVEPNSCLRPACVLAAAPTSRWRSYRRRPKRRWRWRSPTPTGSSWCWSGPASRRRWCAPRRA